MSQATSPVVEATTREQSKVLRNNPISIDSEPLPKSTNYLLGRYVSVLVANSSPIEAGMRILVADADKALASFVKQGLQSEAYAVDVVGEGEDAQYMAIEYNYDIFILDLNLPTIDGIRVLKQVRAKKPLLPILILSVRASVDARVKCLDDGADDFIAKPFSFREVSARVRALLRRSSRPSELSLVVEDLELNRVDHIVKRAGRRLELTPKEFALLEYLMGNVGHVVSRAMIVDHVWDLSFDTMTNVVEVYIYYLRKKVDGGFDRKLIHTVRGAGYCLGDIP